MIYFISRNIVIAATIKNLPIYICSFQINYIRKYSDTMKNTAATITRDGTGTYIHLKNGFKTLLKAR